MIKKQYSHKFPKLVCPFPDAHQKPGQLKQRPAEQAKKTGRNGRQGEELSRIGSDSSGTPRGLSYITYKPVFIDKRATGGDVPLAPRGSPLERLRLEGWRRRCKLRVGQISCASETQLRNSWRVREIERESEKKI